MASATHELMLQMLQACAERAPEPLYPAIYAKERQLDRDKVDVALDDLRRRGLVQLTDWVKDVGQGRALTEAGKNALATKNLAPAIDTAPTGTASTGISTYERGEIVRDAVYEPKRPWVCWSLIALNVAFFLYGAGYAWQHDYIVADYLAGKDGVAQSMSNVVRDLGGLTFHGVFLSQPPQFERIILACFLHLGILHLAINMYSLGSLGDLVESMWGSVRFLALYFVAAIVSGCVVLSLEMLQGRFHLSAGASGALYGAFASMLVWLALNHRHLPDEFLRDNSRTLGINVFLAISMNVLPGISWQGHLGGAIGGALAALLLHVQRFHPSALVRMLALCAVPLIPIGFFAAMLWEARML